MTVTSMPLPEFTSGSSSFRTLPGGLGPDLGRSPQVIDQELFRTALVRERKRADRSNRTFALLLVKVNDPSRASRAFWRAVTAAMTAATRETDVQGWLEREVVLAAILPEMSAGDSRSDGLEARVWLELGRRVDESTLAYVSVRVLVHAGAGREAQQTGAPLEELLFPGPSTPRTQLVEKAKRGLDVGGSLTLLLLLSPLFLLIAAAVKLTSRGPVFFRQPRVGQMMRPFTMLKFRTMHSNAGHAVHQEYVTRFIKSGGQGQSGKAGLFKLTNDSRVTPVGRVLRKTSMDELPQLWNVLRGDMSLVGPRPPLQYEVDNYQSWHCRRVLEAKPGITGLWQVAGRSRTTFDEMVRLDLQYARTRSLTTDLKILLATPWAVIVGKGAC